MSTMHIPQLPAATEIMDAATEKSRILFVDDEPNVLEGLRRMLRHQRNIWEVTFATSGDEALAFLTEHPAHVIVSDLRMPGMDGLTLLDAVRDTAPETVRIALSGYSDKEETLRAVSHIHQFLAKPCDADTLCTTLERALRLSALLCDERVRRLVASFTVLPSIASVYDDVVSQLESPAVSLKEVGLILSRDPGMSTKVLQLVNSPLMGLNQLVSDPAHATALLGLDTMKTLVLSVKLFQLFEANEETQEEVAAVWTHSVRVAHFAKRIAEKETGDDFTAECAFLAGLLHDIGKVVFAINLPEKYAMTLRLSAAHVPARSQVETRVIGASHGEVAAYLIGLWGFSERVIEAVAHHHHPLDAPVSEFDVLAAVHIANALVHWNDCDPSAPLDDYLSRPFIERLGLVKRTGLWQSMLQKMQQQETAQ